MDESATRAIEQLQRVMQAGFDTVADILRETKEEIHGTREELLSELHGTRVDLLGEIRDTNRRLGRLETRFDNFLDIAGHETRKLREEVDDLRSRLERLERRAA